MYFSSQDNRDARFLFWPRKKALELNGADAVEFRLLSLMITEVAEQTASPKSAKEGGYNRFAECAST